MPAAAGEEAALLWLPVAVVVMIWLVLPVWALVALQGQRRELLRLRERVQRLEAERGAVLAPVPSPAEARATPPPPEPIPFPRPEAAPPDEPAPPPTAAAAPRVPPPAPPTPGSGSAGAFFDSARAEDLVGGLWLQNVGAVLVLLGAFFSILWGYTTGRLGPGVLVGAGALLGLALMWRGDRLARSLPPLGHALIGVGLGIVYLSVYLGWFTLHVLATPAAFVLLALVSAATVLVGLRYRAQAIAALGVLGAFLPHLLAEGLGLRGFDLSQGQLLAYLALVNAVVFVLAARAGWAALDLAALLLTALTWIGAAPAGHWGWGMEIGLAALFAAFGLAPVPWRARDPRPVPGFEIAVVALAPLLFAAVSWPFIAYVARGSAAMLLFAVAALYLAVALWVDRRRAESDLWRPLAAAATLFVTVALERAAGAEYAALAWLAEGLALAWLGAGRRGAWLRGLGAAVSALGGFAHAVRLFQYDAVDPAVLPVLHAGSLRALAGIALVLATGAVLGSERRFTPEWRTLLGRGWAVGGNLMLMAWGAIEANHLARALEQSGGRWAQPPALGAAPVGERIGIKAAVSTSAAWTVQAAVLLALGWWRGSAFLRWLGLGLLGVTVLKVLLADLAQVDVFWRFVSAIAVGAVLLAVSYAYQRRIRRERPGGG